jgi:L-ribulose-5-phosphate 3-epimerase
MEPPFRISLACWSMHRMFFAGEVSQFGMVDLCAELGIARLELVNTLFPSPVYTYLKQLRRRAADQGVDLTLIMCDAEGNMGAEARPRRLHAARNHHKWVDIAVELGCRAIRANPGGEAPDRATLERNAESFSALVEYAAVAGVDVLVENHFGPSADAAWLARLIEAVPHPRFGALPDFGGSPDDPYGAVRTLLPYARGVSAKCYDFDERGEETTIDFARMLRIVRDAGFHGDIGIEFEGERLSEREGIIACKRLLERLRDA